MIKTKKVVFFLTSTSFGAFLLQTFILPALIFPIILIIYSHIDDYFMIYIISLVIGKPLHPVLSYFFGTFYKEDNRTGDKIMDFLTVIFMWSFAIYFLSQYPFNLDAEIKSNIKIENGEMSF